MTRNFHPYPDGRDSLPDSILVIGIDEQLRPHAAAQALGLPAELQVLQEAEVNELSLHITTAVEGSTVLTPADALASDSPFRGGDAARATHLQGEEEGYKEGYKSYDKIHLWQSSTRM